MDENQPAPNPELQASLSELNSKKTSKKIIILLGVILIAFLLIAGFIAYQFSKEKIPNKSVTVVKTQVKIEKPATASSDIKKIAYVKSNSLWLINSDGTDKKELVASSSSLVSGLTWKNKNDISYIRCTLTCQVVTKNISTGSETVELEKPQILAFAWNSSNNNLAFIYKPTMQEMKLDMESNGEIKTIKNFSLPSIGTGGRGGSLDDDISLSFSPDNNYLLVTNTLTQPNPNDKNTIWVLNNSGKEEVSLEASGSAWPTQASWTGNNVFIFKAGNNFGRQTLGEGSETLFSSINSYGPVKPNQEPNIYYWVNNPKGLPKVVSYEMDSKVGPTTEGFYKPQLLNPTSMSHISANNLVVLKAKEVGEEETILPFAPDGISVIGDGGNIIDLDNGEIEEFAIEP